ncbi:acyl-CoA thioesterase [Amycolatopsis samaneae]|uniref:Acyl-CoA thioesterase n=1 Tax=Amycolatopsis samaneae TaxID=664691 RepID=A0ABW5GG56_9PSEU
MTFSVRVVVRGYELDLNGHLGGAVYHQYGDHARWECLRAAGITVAELQAAGLSPVTLESTIRYHRELTAGDEVEITCEFLWGEGKTFRVVQELRRDGEPAAEIASVGGLLDPATRRLVPEPGTRWRALATAPERLGL